MLLMLYHRQTLALSMWYRQTNNCLHPRKEVERGGEEDISRRGYAFFRAGLGEPGLVRRLDKAEHPKDEGWQGAPVSGHVPCYLLVVPVPKHSLSKFHIQTSENPICNPFHKGTPISELKLVERGVSVTLSKSGNADLWRSYAHLSRWKSLLTDHSSKQWSRFIQWPTF